MTKLHKMGIFVFVLFISAAFYASYHFQAEAQIFNCANPPPGTIFCDDFEDGNLNDWRFGNNGGPSKFRINTNLLHTKSGARSLQVVVGPGVEGQNGTLNKDFAGVDEVYLRLDVKFQKGYKNLGFQDGNSRGMHFASLRGCPVGDQCSKGSNAGETPDGTDFFTTTFEPEHRKDDPMLLPFRFYTYHPDKTTTFGELTAQEEPKIPAIFEDQWQEFIIRLKTNTPGKRDGLQELWVDGVKKISKTGMRWRDISDLKIGAYRISVYLPQAVQTQSLWIDNIVISTQPLPSLVGEGPVSNFCHLLDSSRSVPEGFGAAYNVLTSAKEVLLKAICGESTVGYPVGNGSSLQYIFNQGYYWTGSNWQTFSYTCQGQTVGSWCVGNADFTRQLSTTQLQTTNYYVAYICNWTGSAWKCGCRDSACTQNFWNLQAFKK